MNIKNVAIVYDDSLRPETTGRYCLEALGELVSVQHLRPQQIADLSQVDFDLLVRVDDGLDYHLAEKLHPQAVWVIDTHLAYERSRRIASKADFVFAAQKDGTEKLNADGIKAAWLPLASHPQVHRRHKVRKKHDVCFIGNLLPGRRAQLISILQQNFNNCLIDRAYFEQMAKAYSASRTVFNCSVLNDLNMRLFEALACGSILVTNDLSDNGQAELFQDGVHLATYHDSEEMIDKIQFYLARPRLRSRVQNAGREAVLARHTYRHRMETILSAVETAPCSTAVLLGRTAPKRGSEPSPPKDRSLGPSAITDPSYFEFARPEVVDLVPTDAKRIVDIGCGAGLLGAAIKRRQDCELIGIELNEHAAAAAQQRLDRVIALDIEESALDIEPGSLDCVICADVLEHLRDPQATLRKIRTWLGKNGVLVASIPNVQHRSVVTGLLAGNWTYEPAGLLDESHLHFFTRETIEQTFSACGYEIETLSGILGPGDHTAAEKLQSPDVRLGSLALVGMPPQLAEGFLVYQYLLIARPNSDPPSPPVTVAQPARTRHRLGCVMAVRNRPPQTLARTLQTYRYQSICPIDRVLVDYGSSQSLAGDYRQLCDDFGWQYLRVRPGEDEWNLSVAYNTAVSSLCPDVEVVFKNDVDILLGENVLQLAWEHGRHQYCVFPVLAAAEQTAYPQTITHQQLCALVEQTPKPLPIEGEGIHAYPKQWFERIGGFDLTFRKWGFQESDLRFRATNSIGKIVAEDTILLHQWHPIEVDRDQAAKNRAYYESTKNNVQVVRNNGRLLSPVANPPAAEQRIPPSPAAHCNGKLSVAFGPHNPVAGSWDWFGVDLAKELSQYFNTTTFAQQVPPCDVAIVLKFPNSIKTVLDSAKSSRPKLVYLPVDLFSQAEDIAAAADLLCECDRIVISCERLRKHFDRFAPLEFIPHHVRYIDANPKTFRQTGFILWVGWQSMLPPLVQLVGSHRFRLPLTVLTTPENSEPLWTPAQIGFPKGSEVTIERWSPQRHRELIGEAKAAVDVKGPDFQQQHKPPTKALDFIGSGIPTAVNRDSSVSEQLLRMGFEAPSPQDQDHWFSREYFEETAGFAAQLRQMYSLRRIGIRYKRMIEQLVEEDCNANYH